MTHIPPWHNVMGERKNTMKTDTHKIGTVHKRHPGVRGAAVTGDSFDLVWHMVHIEGHDPDYVAGATGFGAATVRKIANCSSFGEYRRAVRAKSKSKNPAKGDAKIRKPAATPKARKLRQIDADGPVIPAEADLKYKIDYLHFRVDGLCAVIDILLRERAKPHRRWWQIWK